MGSAAMRWVEVSEARYDEMLGMLPPAVTTYYGFLVGEPFDHRECEVTRIVRASYAAFVLYHGKYYEGPNMTAPEFRKLNLEAVLCPMP